MAQETIKWSDRVKVVATKKAKHLKEGSVHEFHPKQAEKLVEEGKVELYDEKKHGKQE